MNGCAEILSGEPTPPAAPAASGSRTAFVEQGYVGPLRVLSEQDCAEFLEAAQREPKRPKPEWFKGRGATSRAFHRLATHPAILNVVAELIGDDILLWGASIVTKPPGAIHPWHTDIETAEVGDKTVSVWIGLEHSQHDSSLQFISYSHHAGKSVQQLRQQHRKHRDETTSDDVLRWAREQDRRSDLLKHDVTDGEALFFDGRLWHASHNVSKETRRALLLHYATPDALIRIPDPKNLDWPFVTLSKPRPPCVIVRGHDKYSINHVVPGPGPGAKTSRPRIVARIDPLSLPLSPGDQDWKPYSLFSGSTSELASLTCHASTLKHGCTPHPPHWHPEEELLILLAGEVDLNLPDLRNPHGAPKRRLRAGECVYYPPQFTHTLQTASVQPANYLMFKWLNDRPAKTGKTPLAFGHFNLSGAGEHSPADAGFLPRVVFEGPTAGLRKLRCHVSTLAPQAGYAPHTDPYDVAVVVLEGEVETLGQRVAPCGVVFYPAGEPHGMRNCGKTRARYAVLEFHGAALNESAFQPYRWLPAKFRDRRYWKRKFKRLFTRAG